MSDAVYLAGLETIADFLDSLGDEDRELTEDDRKYLNRIVEATKQEAAGKSIPMQDEKAMSAYDATRGGALIHPPAQGLRRRKIDAPRIKSLSLNTKGNHNPGDTWRGQSGRWFTMTEDRRVVPGKDPSAREEQPKQDNASPEQEQMQSGQPNPEEAKKSVMEKIGEYAKASTQKANEIYRKFKVSTLRKLSPGKRNAIKNIAKTSAAVEHAMQKFTHGAQHMVDEIIREKGYPTEKAKKISDMVKWTDFALSWTVNIPVMHQGLHEMGATGLGGFFAAKFAYYVPVASMAYIAASTFVDPLSTIIAADKIIKQHKQSEGMKEEHTKALDEVSEGFDESSIRALCDLSDTTEDMEWFQAVYCTAFDHTQKPSEAIELTKKVIASYPVAPETQEGMQDQEQHERKQTMIPGVKPSPLRKQDF